MDRTSVVGEDVDVDPVQAGLEPRAPDHVGCLQNATIIEGGNAVLHMCGPGKQFDACRGQVLALGADERRAIGQEPRHGLAADRRCKGQHVVPREPYEGQDKAGRVGPVFDRKLSDAPS